MRTSPAANANQAPPGVPGGGGSGRLWGAQESCPVARGLSHLHPPEAGQGGRPRRRPPGTLPGAAPLDPCGAGVSQHQAWPREAQTGSGPQGPGGRVPSLCGCWPGRAGRDLTGDCLHV